LSLLTLTPDTAPSTKSAIKYPEVSEAEHSLREYVKQSWHIVEPATEYLANWHIDAICEHLEAVTRSEIRNLLITMPPRCAKSLCVAVFWPTWVWITQPSWRWLFASYAGPLSIRDSLKCRRIITSHWYQDRWGDRFILTGDQNAKIRFENNQTGYRLATSVGGAVTGEGGHVVICDDPHKAEDAHRDTTRESVLVWWDETMSTRLNDPKTGCKVIVQQRLHQEDLAGHVLQQGGYEHLNLPMRYEPTTYVSALGWSDPRTKDGELLWPERFGEKEVAALETILGTYGAAGQLQQRPAPLGGGMVKIEWFKRYGVPPAKFTRIVQSWDTANKAKELNDPWACTTWGETENGYYVLDCFTRRMEYPEGKRTVINLAEKWKPSAIIIEDKSSGMSLLQDLKRDTKLPVLPIEPEADKVTRMAVESPTIESGRVWLPETAPWLFDFETEMSSFPNAAHDDIVDSVSQALKWFTKRRSGFQMAPVTGY
jgi:predicted phage terminase large subunit-like protein